MGKHFLNRIIKFPSLPPRSTHQKGTNNRRKGDIPLEVAENAETNVQASGNRSLSAYEGDQKFARLELDYKRLSKQHEKLRAEQNRLSNERQALKTAVSMRESQILVLRPYRTKFTRYEARRDFEDLLGSIKSWVEEWTDKFVDDKEFSKRWVDSLEYFPQVINPFRQFLDSNPDLSSAVGYNDSDQDILCACLIRFIRQKIFGELPCTIAPHTADVLRYIEHNMAFCTEPKLDMSTICSWRAEAYHALFSDRQYPDARQRGVVDLSAELVHILGFVSKSPNTVEFTRSISSKIIEPSFKLYENFRRSEEDYYFETAEWAKPGAQMSQNLPDGRLRELLGDLDCRNAVKSSGIFRVEKLETKTTDEELRNQLYFICSINPSLKVRGLRGNNGEESTTLLKERVLVAWDPDTLRGEDPRILKRQTWLSRICSN
ncbi:hypothetical protein F4803DRAFT_570346 [Xylaria telfairii]|nr:hypothetical protein F4803DRAFT_570346 [Xylaria telfairii]